MPTSHFDGTSSLCQDPHLNRFFQQCQKRELDLSLPPTSNFLNCLKVSECPSSISPDSGTNPVAAACQLILPPPFRLMCFFPSPPPPSLPPSVLSSYSSFPFRSPLSCFSRVCWAWRGSQWSSASCQCSSTSCSRSWLRTTMMRSPLPPRGRLRYCSVQNGNVFLSEWSRADTTSFMWASKLWECSFHSLL